MITATRGDLLALRMLASIIQAAIPLLVLAAVLALLAGAPVALRRVALGRRLWLLSAVPDPLPLVHPPLVLPHVVVRAGGIATRPMIVLPEARAAWVGATPGRLAVLTVVRAGQCVAVPDMIVPRLPPIVPPLVIVAASRIAAGPVVVLPEACAPRVRAALCLPAIFPVVGTCPVEQHPARARAWAWAPELAKQPAASSLGALTLADGPGRGAICPSSMPGGANAHKQQCCSNQGSDSGSFDA